jgi:hypothetical protein
MLMINSDEAMGGAVFRDDSDKLKMVGNRILMKNCKGMSSQNPVGPPFNATVVLMRAAMIDVPNSSFAGAIHRIKKVPVNLPVMNKSMPRESPVAATELLMFA